MDKIQIKEKIEYFQGVIKKLDDLHDNIDFFVDQTERDLKEIDGRSTCWSLEVFQKPTSAEIASGDVSEIGGNLLLTLGSVNDQSEGPCVEIELTYDQVDEILDTLEPKKASSDKVRYSRTYGPDSWA